MPFRRRRHTFHRHRRRHHAASKIGRAWRARRRRRTGLLTRTALANRRTIRRITKAVETKVVDDNQANANSTFEGQYADDIVVDNTGQEVAANIPFAGDLLYLNQGSASNKRVGSWIQLKSLTMHYCVTLPVSRGCDMCQYELFVVLDRSPTLGASLTGATGLLTLESANPAPQNALALAFQNLAETGKHGRFKILARKRHVLSNFLPSSSTLTQVPAITQAAAGQVMRPLYNEEVVQQRSRSYPCSITGSINLKLGYKINYGPNTAVQPTNQTIRIMAFQTAPTGRPIPQAVLQYYTRVRYKDD